MTIVEDLSGGLCVGRDPGLWDPDSHRHIYLGGRDECWICDEARDFCIRCPVVEACFRTARRNRESHMIMAGFLWTNGRPRELRKRKR